MLQISNPLNTYKAVYITSQNDVSFKGQKENELFAAFENGDKKAQRRSLQNLNLDFTAVNPTNSRNILHYAMQTDNEDLLFEVVSRAASSYPSHFESLFWSKDDFNKVPYEYYALTHAGRTPENLPPALMLADANLRLHIAEGLRMHKNSMLPSVNNTTSEDAAAPSPVTPPSNTLPAQAPQPPTAINAVNSVAELNQVDDLTDEDISFEYPEDDSDNSGEISSAEDFMAMINGLPAGNRPNVVGVGPNSGMTIPLSLGATNVGSPLPDDEFELTLDDVICPQEVKDELRNSIIDPLKNTEQKYNKKGIPVANGFLLYGPSGNAKTLIALALGCELQKIGVSCQKVESLDQLISTLGVAAQLYKNSGQPTLCFIDNIEALIGKDVKNVPKIANLFDNCAKNGVILLGVTSRKDDLYEDAIRTSRFDKHIEVVSPEYELRKQLVEMAMKKFETLKLSEDDIARVAKMTSGFSCSAVMFAVEETCREIKRNEKTEITADDVEVEIKKYAEKRKIGEISEDNPTSVYDTFLKRYDTRKGPKDFSAVAGMKELKSILQNSIVDRLKPAIRARCEKEKIRLFNDGFLLYGPPGNGKTYIAEALAGETGIPLYKLEKSVYESSLVGESVKNLKKVFEQLETKFWKTGEYSILFIDEADAILSKRSESGELKSDLTNTLLQYLNNATHRGIIPILATNAYDKIDEAVKRSGRCGKHINVPTPDFEARRSMFCLLTKDKEITKNITDDDLNVLARMLSGFSASDITHLTNETLQNAIIEGREEVNVAGFKEAIKNFSLERNMPEVNDSNITSQYDTFLQRFNTKHGPKDFSVVAGMNEVKSVLRKSIIDRLKPEVRARFEKEKIQLFNDGFIFYGPPGNGKTYIAEAIAGETGIPLYKLEKSVYESSYAGESVKNIKKIFDQLETKFRKTGEYSFLFIDEADAILSKRSESGELKSDLTNTLLQYLNNATKKGIIPILATNAYEKIDEAVKRSGRCGKHINIPTPDFEARRSMFQLLIKDKEITKNITDDDLNVLARMLNGFSASDITHLTNETLQGALTEGYEEVSVTDFKDAIKKFSHERNMPEVNDLNITSQYDTVLHRIAMKPSDPKSLDDIGGMKEAKYGLYESVISAFDPEIMKANEENGISPPNGTILYGPPGCGKTYIVKAVAQQAKLPMYELKMSEVGSKYIHETSGRITAVFKQLKEKYEKTGEASILFIDEFDSIAGNRESLGGNQEYKNEEINTLLAEMNNPGKNGIAIIAATNHIEKIDSAIARSGRFDKKIYVGLPDPEARYEVIKTCIKGKKLATEIYRDEEKLQKLAQMTEGFNNADISTAIMTALRATILKKNDKVTFEDFEAQFQKLAASKAQSNR